MSNSTWAGRSSVRVAAVRAAGLGQDLHVTSPRRFRMLTRQVGAVVAHLEVSSEGFRWTLGRAARLVGARGSVWIPRQRVAKAEVANAPGKIRRLGGALVVTLENGRRLTAEFLGSQDTLREALAQSLDEARPGPDDALWDTYAGALIDCTIDGRVCHLRGPGADPLPAVAPIFVLTAWNPGGVDRDRAANDAGEALLEHELASAGLTFWPALGRSRDHSWSEPGVAVAGLDRARACALGERYGQLAVYELTADEVLVVDCPDQAVIRRRARPQ